MARRSLHMFTDVFFCWLVEIPVVNDAHQWIEICSVPYNVFLNQPRYLLPNERTGIERETTTDQQMNVGGIVVAQLRGSDRCSHCPFLVVRHPIPAPPPPPSCRCRRRRLATSRRRVQACLMRLATM